MGTERLLQAAAIVAASALLGGCAQFTGSDGVEIDEELSISDDGTGVAVPLPANQEIACAYPFAEAYSPAVDSIISPDIAWSGYAAGEDIARLFPLTELYDCSGKEVHAIVVDTSKFF